MLFKKDNVILTAKDKDEAQELKVQGYKAVKKEELLPEKEGGSSTSAASEKMTHDELDALAKEKEVPEDVYPKSGDKKEKAAAINTFLSGE